MPTTAPELPAPPEWSMLVGTIGRGAILVAVALFLVAALSFLIRQRKAGGWLFAGGCVGIFTAFASLASLFIGNRFEYTYVYGHADSHNAILYRLAGIWSGQEGSFLLWAVASAVFGILMAPRARAYRPWFTIIYSVFLASLCGILAFESPFNLHVEAGQVFVPPDGVGLAPSLQNYWVIIHPPTIFLGFGSLTALFALASAALITRDYNDWVPIVRPWAIAAMAVLGVGLCMGGFWAYETLGWGGFWMWDPVENVSFVPWCFTIALVHGLMIQSAKQGYRFGNLLLAALPFLSFCYGTFLTRSGFLSEASVHSFAEMDRSALRLLVGIVLLTTVGFFGMWSFRALRESRQEAKPETATWGRRGLYTNAIILVTILALAVTFGMSVPFVMSLRHEPTKVVEEGLYHQVVSWFFIPIMLLMAIAPFASWRGRDPKEFGQKIYSILCITIGLTGVVLLLMVLTPYKNIVDLSPTVTLLGKFKVKGLAWLTFLVGVCLFVIVGNVWRVVELGRRSKLGLSPFFAHVGFALLMAGLIISRGFERHGRTAVMDGITGRTLAYEISYKGMTRTTSDRDNQVEFEIRDPHKDKLLFVAKPGLYDVQMGGETNVMVWPHIERGLLYDTYVSLGQPQHNATEEVSLKPGQSTRYGQLTLTNEGMTREGEFGMEGTKFGAKIRVRGPDTSRTIEPKMEIGRGDVKPIPVKLDDRTNLLMTGMNAGDKSVMLQLQLNTPIYPIDVYHKPMTSLVWFGTGLLTLAGLLAAYYRREPSLASSRHPAAAPVSTTLDEQSLAHGM